MYLTGTSGVSQYFLQVRYEHTALDKEAEKEKYALHERWFFFMYNSI